MFAVRHAVRKGLQRTYATRPFIPPSQLNDMNRRRRGRRRLEDEDDAEPDVEEEVQYSRKRDPPESSTFYTARSVYYDQVEQLETAIKHARQALKTLHLLPLPDFARASLLPLQPVWKDKEEMSDVLRSSLTTSRYRRVIGLLSQLNDFNRIARTAGCTELADGIAHVVNYFERGNKDAVLARGKKKVLTLDEYGRSYTFGRRKTSTARVWMIPVQPETQAETSSNPSSITTSQQETSTDSVDVEGLLGLEKQTAPDSSPSPLPAPSAPNKFVSVSVTTVLVNNLPLAEYFPLSADRERVMRPLKVAGVLGAYNVFCLVRGGGTSGQSGAICQGVAKGLVVHEPSLEPLLKRSKLIRRDPRMVERKKTGLAKSRKRYAWVKR